MSRHPSAELLSAYLDGESSERQARQVEEHLRGCDLCREHLEGLRDVVGGLRSIEPAVPPRRLGLELQSRLVQSMPPFEGRSRGPGGRLGRLPRLLFQPAILATIGVVLALAVVALLFLQALERRPRPAPTESSELHERAEMVVIGERRFRPRPGGWTQVGLSRAEVDSAERVSRDTLSADPGLAAIDASVLQRLEGEITLRLDDGRVVTLAL